MASFKGQQSSDVPSVRTPTEIAFRCGLNMARPSKQYQAAQKRRAGNPCESPAQTPPIRLCTFRHGRVRIRLAASDLPFYRNDKAEDLGILWVDALTVLEGDIPAKNDGIPLRDVFIPSHLQSPPSRRNPSVGPRQRTATPLHGSVQLGNSMPKLADGDEA